MEVATSNKWKDADKAFAKGQEAYIELGLALLKIDATQEEIGARYDMSQQQVSQCTLVAGDNRITFNKGKLPKSPLTMYLLTTLDDKGFSELCKPDTTQAKVLEYKRRLSAPAPKANPEPAVPTGGIERTAEYYLNDEDERKTILLGEEAFGPNRYDTKPGTMSHNDAADKLRDHWNELFQPQSEIGLAFMKFCLSRAYHPDTGVVSKDDAKMAEVNGLITLLQERLA